MQYTAIWSETLNRDCTRHKSQLFWVIRHALHRESQQTIAGGCNTANSTSSYAVVVVTEVVVVMFVVVVAVSRSCCYCEGIIALLIA